MGGIVGQAALEQVLNVARPTRTPAYHQFILHRINLRDLLIMVVIDNNNSATLVMIMTVASLYCHSIVSVCLVGWPIHVQFDKLSCNLYFAQ